MIPRSDSSPARDAPPGSSERLITVVQDLSLARDVAEIVDIVRTAARELASADGASFVLRDGDLCYYVDEDAIAPLWKGRRFPMTACISGWVMLHREAVALEDVYEDPRIPADAYRPTFVKSLAMVPIRTKAPVGAIGVYWASPRMTTPEELCLLQALADSTSVALANAALCAELERRVEERTLELESAHRELSRRHQELMELQRQKMELSALVVHDLRSPAAGIMVSASARLRSEELPAAERRSWSSVHTAAELIQRTATNLLDIASGEEGQLSPKLVTVDVVGMLEHVREIMSPLAERRAQRIEICADVPSGAVLGDQDLLRRAVQNLVDNALRHSPAASTVRVGGRILDDGWIELDVCDHGPGIPVHLRERIFDKYVRLDHDADGAGRGLGLLFCRLAVEAHGGAIWVEDNAPRGSRFCLRLPLRSTSAGTERRAGDGPVRGGGLPRS